MGPWDFPGKRARCESSRSIGRRRFLVHGLGLRNKLVENLANGEDILDFKDIFSGENKAIFHVALAGRGEPIADAIDMVAFFQAFVLAFLGLEVGIAQELLDKGGLD